MRGKSHYQLQTIQDEVICFHHITRNNQKGETLPFHRHDAYEIYLFIQGNTELYIEQSSYHLSPGNLVITNPRELHRTICLDETPYERYGINIKRTTLEHLSSKKTNLLSCFEKPPGRKNLTSLTKEQVEEFIVLYEDLQSSLSGQEYGSDLLVQANLIKLLVFVNTMFDDGETVLPADAMPSVVKNTMEYINQHLAEEITLEDLTDQFYLNGRYISQQFKKYTGLTIRQYILEQRICLAKSLLLEGKNVSEACYLSGFSDYSNFIRSFTKQSGMSPGKYKKHMLENSFE